MKSILYLLLFVCFCSCSNGKQLEQALKLAGTNRAELENVLQHYSHNKEDSLKYQAAVFLIENMPGKYSEDDRPFEAFEAMFDEWLDINAERNYITSEVFDSLVLSNNLTYKKQQLFDIERIQASYLINNIDRSFEVWRNMPWGKDIPFDVFCEEILPYRLQTEALENWRDIVIDQYRSLYDSLRMSNADVFTATIRIFDAMGMEWEPSSKSSTLLPPVNYRMINKLRVGTCTQRVKFGIFVMRAFGIPINWDYTPQWPFRQTGHDWASVRLTDGKYKSFIPTEDRPEVPHKADHRMAKAYRHAYGTPKNTMQYIAPKENKPSLFYDPFLLDVSSFYFQGADVSIDLKYPAGKNKFVYISVFDNKNWIPIHWAECHEKVVFSYMGKDIVYLPVYFNHGRIDAAHSPFIFTKQGEIHLLEADTTKRQSVKLYRKYPLLYKWIVERMIGGKFQGANCPDFSDAVTLYTISDLPETVYNEVILDHSSQFRFYRYLSPPDAHCNIAELEFYGSDEEKRCGTMIGTIGSMGHNPNRTYDKAFDGDVLSFFDSAEPNDAWVGMDFTEKIKLSKIRYLPRNDDNNIVPGQIYELFYFGEKNWCSLGRRVADDIVLQYDNAPLHALFLLRNLSKGVEERIFTYENGEQVWW